MKNSETFYVVKLVDAKENEKEVYLDVYDDRNGEQRHDFEDIFDAAKFFEIESAEWFIKDAFEYCTDIGEDTYEEFRKLFEIKKVVYTAEEEEAN